MWLKDNRYGDEKGACENIFSYGFLEDNVTSAKVMFLGLDIPDDDPLRPAKMFVSTAAPGFRIFEDGDSIAWESNYIWLAVINEEDGLDFRIRQTIDGKRDIQAFWKEEELNDTSKLREYLQEDPVWDVFQLRATVLLQNRIDEQKEAIQATQGLAQDLTVRDVPWRLAERLRNLELDMLVRAAAMLDSQVRYTLLHPAFFQGSSCLCTKELVFGDAPSHEMISHRREIQSIVALKRSRANSSILCILQDAALSIKTLTTSKEYTARRYRSCVSSDGFGGASLGTSSFVTARVRHTAAGQSATIAVFNYAIGQDVYDTPQCCHYQDYCIC